MDFNCIIYTNATYDEAKALSVDGEIIMTGDYYHDKIDTLIRGFFYGLEYAGFTIIVEEVSLHPSDELFEACGFINEGEGDLE